MERGYYFQRFEGTNHLLGYIFSIIKSGFSIGNLAFKFLGYSNSQLKNHSCWFLCTNNPDKMISEEQIVSFMGNFEKEKNILKKFARKGQCFSSSKYVCTLKKSEVQLALPDIKRNGFTFTDGVGYISSALASKIARKSFRINHSSAFQIRLAGAKGVLMVNPELDALAEGDEKSTVMV